jgi:hypothetical protein
MFDSGRGGGRVVACRLCLVIDLHLEPVTRAVVGSDAAGGLGHVKESRAGMLDELVVENLQADLVSGADFVGLGSRVGLGTLVASEIVAGSDLSAGR